MQLRIFDDGESQAASATRGELLRRFGPGYKPELEWTLRQFFLGWFCPSVLHSKDARPGTIERYDECLRYWEAITGDPPLGLIGDADCAKFVSGLKVWGYSRRGVPRGKGRRIQIGPLEKHPGFYPLSATTRAAHVHRLATLLAAAGPQRQSLREPRARLLADMPYVPRVEAEADDRLPFTLDEARAIAAACTRMALPRTLPRRLTPLWWQAAIALLYFTGLRSGTVRELRWRHLEDDEAGQLWLNVPGDIIKTGKPVRVSVHAELASLLAALPRDGASDEGELILCRGCNKRHFATLHERLQELAGIPEPKRQSPHAWRRTHATQMDLLGASRGLEIARLALDHADGLTTSKSYVGQVVVNQLRLQLPPLFAPEGEAKSA